MNVLPRRKEQLKSKKEGALSLVKRETLTSATGSGSFHTSRTAKAGSSDGSIPGNDNALSKYSLSEANSKYKEFVYDGNGNSVYRSKNQVKALYDTNTGMLHLMDAAEQSSFVHEAAHMWLSEMESMILSVIYLHYLYSHKFVEV